MSQTVENDIREPEGEGSVPEGAEPEPQGHSAEDQEAVVEYEAVGQAVDEGAVNPPAPQPDPVDSAEARAQALHLKAQATDMFKAARYQEVV